MNPMRVLSALKGWLFPFRLSCNVKWNGHVLLTWHMKIQMLVETKGLFSVFFIAFYNMILQKMSTLHVYSGWGLGCVQAARALPLGELFLIPTVGWDLSKEKVGEDAPE